MSFSNEQSPSSIQDIKHRIITAFHEAGNGEAVPLSLEGVRKVVGADPSFLMQKITKQGGVFLHGYMCRGNESGAILQFLLDSHPEACLAKDDLGMTPLHAACACKERAPNVDCLRILVEKEPRAAQERDNGGNLPLHLAFQNEGNFRMRDDRGVVQVSLECIELLVNAYPASRLEKNNDERIPIQIALDLFEDAERAVIFQLDHDDVGIMEHMVHQCPDSLSYPDGEGRLPLHRICEWPRLDEGTPPANILNLILDTFPSSCQVPNKQQGHLLPLHVLLGTRKNEFYTAARLNSPNFIVDSRLSLLSVIKALIKIYPKACEMEDICGRLPLHLACSKGFSPLILQVLLDAHPNGGNHTDSDGRLALHHACSLVSCEQAGAVKLLVRKNPDSVQKRNGKGMLPLEEAFSALRNLSAVPSPFLDKPTAYDHWNKTFQFLLSFQPKILALVDDQGRLVLHNLLLRIENWENPNDPQTYHAEWIMRIVHDMLEKCPMAALVRDREGNLPLVYACTNRDVSVDVLRLLVQHSIQFLVSPPAPASQESNP